MAAEVKIFNHIEAFAKTDRTDIDEYLEDQIVWVPPWNSSEGWIGFNVTLPNRWKVNYEAYGIILPNDGDLEPNMVMRVVNLTGSLILRFGGFDEPTWLSTKIYTAAFLNRSMRSCTFKFMDIDNSSKYVFLFRGLKNETAPRPILISVKEAWFEQNRLLEPTPLNIAIVAATASSGLITTIKSFHHPSKRQSGRRQVHQALLFQRNR
jgi:hypothetical protein